MSVSVSRHEKGWWQRTDGVPGRGVRGGACVSGAGTLRWKPEEGADRRRVTQLPRGGKRPLALDPGNSGAFQTSFLCATTAASQEMFLEKL